MRIDLNSDVGESHGPWRMGHDEALVPLVSSVNIACGFHAGDPLTMARTVDLAIAAGAAIGAHPGYPDLVGFGRRALDMDAHDLEAAIVYQVGALGAFARAAGARLSHVKPHGALYDRAAREPAVAELVARAVRRVDAELVYVGLAGSAGLEAARSTGIRAAGEAFADRAYEPDGSLRSRRGADAVLSDPADAARQAVAIVRDQLVRAHDGSTVRVDAETLCIHGDTPGAPEVARAVRDALAGNGIDIRALGA